jgi:hypothetical protein
MAILAFVFAATWFVTGAIARLPELGELRWLHPELRSSSHWTHRWSEVDSNSRSPHHHGGGP